MKRFFILCAAAMALTSCDRAPENPMDRADLQCGNYRVAVDVYQDRLDATFDGVHAKLKQDVSASGAKYVGKLSDNSVVLWNKGELWMMIENDGPSIDCVRVAKEALD